MEWAMPNESRICRRVLILKKKKMGVAGQFAAVKCRSDTKCWTEKLKREDLRGIHVLDTSCCCKIVNTVEKQ